VGNVGDRDKTDMGVLAVEGAAGERLVKVLEPMGADKVGVVGDPAEVACIGLAAFAFFADPDEPLPEQPAIDRAEMEFADQRRSGERMKLRPLGGIIGNRAAVAVEADDIAPAGAGLDRLRGLPGETATEIEVVRIMTAALRLRSGIGFGKPPSKFRQIADHPLDCRRPSEAARTRRYRDHSMRLVVCPRLA